MITILGAGLRAVSILFLNSVTPRAMSIRATSGRMAESDGGYSRPFHLRSVPFAKNG